MKIFARVLKALEDSRNREADLIIRRYARLVDEAHEYDRRRAENKADAAGRSLGAIALDAQVS